MILIDREIEVAQQIDPGYNSYEEAGKLREELFKNEGDIRERLERSHKTIEEIRAIGPGEVDRIYIHAIRTDWKGNQSN